MRPYLISFLLSVLLTHPAQAVITAGEEGRLIAPPVGTYKSSGVQFTGQWGKFVGTAIGPRHFLTAAHVGGGIGDEFTLGDDKYVAEGVTIVEGTDLAVWRVKGTFADGRNCTRRAMRLAKR
jgi:hypothetical protein